MDTRPTDVTVSQFATHLLAEVEQVALSEKRGAAVLPKGEAKLKAMEVDKGKGKGRDKTEGEEKQKPKCKFFLTDGGCRKGKECGFSDDVRDDKRRWQTSVRDPEVSSQASSESAVKAGSLGGGQQDAEVSIYVVFRSRAHADQPFCCWLV